MGTETFLSYNCLYGSSPPPCQKSGVYRLQCSNFPAVFKSHSHIWGEFEIIPSPTARPTYKEGMFPTYSLHTFSYFSYFSTFSSYVSFPTYYFRFLLSSYFLLIFSYALFIPSYLSHYFFIIIYVTKKH